jgi:hypothetical protein
VVALRVCRSRLLCVSLGLSANAVNPVFINRSEPFSFCVFPPSFKSVYTSRKRQRSRKKKKWKNNQSKGPGSIPMEVPAMDDLGKADDIDLGLFFCLFSKTEARGSKQILLRRHCFCYCLSRAA